MCALLTASAATNTVRLITLDPGHFHAGLVQKFMYPQVSPIVHVYAPAGPDLQEHLKRIEGFNTRADHPTHWEEKVYTGPDFLERMLEEKAGNVVVFAGNNAHKTEYINRSVSGRLQRAGRQTHGHHAGRTSTCSARPSSAPPPTRCCSTTS